MATTETKRKQYPEHVLNHADRGTPGFEPICDWSDAVLVPFPNQSGGVYIEPVHPRTWEAWDAYVFLMNHFGVEMSGAGGVNACRNIGSGDWPSLHAYLLAVDLPPNSYKPAAFQAAVLKVECNNGAKVFKNLASINDRMHDEIDCSPADLATGINWFTVEGFDMLNPAQLAAVNTLVAMLASRKADIPTWGTGNWTKYQDEVWTGPDTSDPGWLNPVTHIQLAKVYSVLRDKDAQLNKAIALIQTGTGLTEAEVKALIAATTLTP